MPPDDLLLPPRSRLLLIGPMKTGTTSVQLAAHRKRKELLDHGVRYPGNALNQRRPLGALIGWAVNTWERKKPLRPDLLDNHDAGIPPQKFEQTKVSGIERGVRPLRMNEAVALARITNADLISVFVSSAADDKSMADAAILTERLAYRRLLTATQQVAELQAEADDLEARITRAVAEMESAEHDWQQAHQALRAEGE